MVKVILAIVKNGEEVMSKKEVGSNIKEKIVEAYKEVVLDEEVSNLKKQLIDQLNQAKDNFAMADRQMTATKKAKNEFCRS